MTQSTISQPTEKKVKDNFVPSTYYDSTTGTSWYYNGKQWERGSSPLHFETKDGPEGKLCLHKGEHNNGPWHWVPVPFITPESIAAALGWVNPPETEFRTERSMGSPDNSAPCTGLLEILYKFDRSTEQGKEHLKCCSRCRHFI